MIPSVSLSYGCWNHAVPGAPLLCHQPLEMQIAHYSHLSVRRYTYPYAIFNGLSGKVVAKRPRARFSCCTMTTNLGETFRLALAALRSTVGDAKFREIEKTWV